MLGKVMVRCGVVCGDIACNGEIISEKKGGNWTMNAFVRDVSCRVRQSRDTYHSFTCPLSMYVYVYMCV